MTKYLFLAILYLANHNLPAQTKAVNDSLGNLQSSSGGIAYNRFGLCTIKLKDGTRLINCTLKEIKPLFVVYQKDRAIHDISIERIKCIAPKNDNIVIWFDDNNKAVAGSDCP